MNYIKNQSSKIKKRRGRPRKLEITAEIEAVLRDAAKTDAEIAEKLEISRHTVLRLRRLLEIGKKRGGYREGSGRLRGGVVPAELPPRARLYISPEQMVVWCRSNYKEKITKNGNQVFDPISGSNRRYTYRPPLLSRQLSGKKPTDSQAYDAIQGGRR